MEIKRVFLSTWCDGKIVDAKKVFEINKKKPLMFIVDTNFAIMIREFVVNKNKFKSDYLDLYDDFINAINIIQKYFYRIVYQFACEEASRDKKTGNIDLEKYKLMTRCFANVFKIEVDEISKSNFTEINESCNSTKIPLLRNNGIFKSISIINYVMLLKAFMLKNFDEAKTDKEKVISFLDFMEKEVGVFSPVIQTFAIHYFGRNSNILKGVKKNKGFEYLIGKLYAAAIDLSLPTIAAQSSDATNYFEVPIFVSFDKGVTTIFDSLFINRLGSTPSGNIVPGYTLKIFYNSGWDDDEIVELVNYGNNLQRNTKRKEKRDINEIFPLGEQLEKDLHFFITK